MSKALINVEKLNDILSVVDFGAVGDGVADDTTALQAALAAAFAASDISEQQPFVAMARLGLSLYQEAAHQ